MLMSAMYLHRLVEIVSQIHDDLGAIRKLIEETRPRPKPGHGRYVELAKAIAATAPDRMFTSSELIAHAALPEATILRSAITATIGELNTRTLGKLLKRIEGQNLGGLLVERIGSESDGVCWRIRLFEPDSV